jgi:excisionase family DNA binding protein
MTSSVRQLAILLEKPEQAAALSPANARALLPHLLSLQTVVLARALAVTSGPDAGDSLLTVAQAAPRLGVSPDWLYRRAGRLPFTRRLGRQLRFSSAGLDEYLAAPPSDLRRRNLT